MITAAMVAWSGTPMEVQDWQRELQHCVSKPEVLFELLNLDKSLLPAAHRANQLFPLRVPRGYVARMRRGDVNDPLLRQVLPLDSEFDTVDGYTADPVADLQCMPTPGLLQKYHGRVLLLVTGVCAVHCRYCFRRHFPYADANPARDAWSQALEYIAQRQSIHEVILSGGDPLTLSDSRLARLSQVLEEIQHVKRLRIHTRSPVVLPQRVNASLLAWLTRSRLKKILVIHANHANELDQQVRAALRLLTAGGVTLLNQSVLLRSVNDSLTALTELSEALFDAGVLPYYLHLLDKVQGAAHFEVGERRAASLINQLSARLPGYLVPKLVKEQPGTPAKTLVFPQLPTHGAPVSVDQCS